MWWKEDGVTSKISERCSDFGFYFWEISGNYKATFMYSYYACCRPIDVELSIDMVRIGGNSVFPKEDNA